MPRPRIRATSLVAAAVVAAACAVAGCGADQENVDDGGLTADQQVRATVARFAIATRDKDYQEICDQLLSDELVAKIEGVGLPCEAALQRGLGDVRSPTLKINEVSIGQGRALVSIHTAAAGQKPSDDALQLVRQGRDWKIASLAGPSGSQTTTTTTPTTTTGTSTSTTTTRTKTTKKQGG